MSFFTGLGEKMKPFGQNVGKQFSQIQQYAKERMGSASDVTELPAEYRELEEKVDKIKRLHENFLRVSRNFTLPHYDYEPPLKETMFDFATSVGDKATFLAAAGAKAAGVQAAPPVSPRSGKEETPASLAHAFSRAAYVSVEDLGTEEPLGAALKKFAAAEERVGNSRLQMDADATGKFHQPFSATLNQTIFNAMKARKKVQSVRLTYDACRARLKSAKPENVEPARIEMEASEDEFVAAVDDAMGKMKVVVESPEPLKNLADLVAAQLQYFKSAYEVLAEVSPEIDELQITNEALLRHPTD
ncbi:hypothetical protein BDK51DRAFT_23078 [Blyttiomyces helicus]|uniref:BAR domain-containing protein n=1 Tax=Blyttiomyces helicus TaxID=388810 RepID=A0A4P9W6M8_9FUNG|nr:hypothetical protein BDK51DRAFT_23078 [Blyttiomyces helicus]|eukprot:RKO88119.1 hypothetical protein BDK51DRAFT_23078 [Blyttiomyces helicus]